MYKFLGFLLAGLALAGAAYAGAEKVVYPSGYESRFVRYTTVDKPDRKIVRFMYVNVESLRAAEAGEPAPHGTILVMEDHKAAVDAEGEPRVDSHGRLIPTQEVTNVFVQEKRAGWGAEYSDEKRNGEWEYAWFEADGKPKTGANVNFDRCFACHKAQAEDDDYTFTFAEFVSQLKK